MDAWIEVASGTAPIQCAMPNETAVEKLHMIAERKLLAVPGVGAEIEVLIIRLFQSEADERLGCSRTRVEFSGCLSETHQIAGVDSLESIRLAIEFIEQRVTDLSDACEIRWDDNSPYLIRGGG